VGVEAAAAERRAPQALLPVAGAALAVGVLYMSVFAVPPLITTFIDDLGLSHAEAGALMSVFLGGLLCTSMFSGRLNTRFGPRRLIVAGLLIGGLASASFAITQIYPLMLVFRVGLGVAVGLVYAPGITFVTSLLARDRANLGVGMFLCGVPTGIVISFFATPLLAHALSWRWPFWIFAGAAFAGAAIFQAISGENPTAEHAAVHAGKISIRDLLANRTFRLLLAALFVGMFVVYGIFTWIAPFLDESAGFSTDQISFASALLAATGIPGTIGSGWLASRTGRPLAVSAAGFCLPLVLLVFVFEGTPSLALATAVATISAFGVSVGTSPLYASGPMLFRGAGGGTAAGLSTAAGMSGAVVSTYAGGWIVGASGYSAAFAIYVGATAAVGLLIVPLAALSLGHRSARSEQTAVEGSARS